MRRESGPCLHLSLITHHSSLITHHSSLSCNDDGACAVEFGEVFGVDGADAAQVADGFDQLFGREEAVVWVCGGTRPQSSLARALELVPEIPVASHPLFAPGPRRVARGRARWPRQTQEEKLG